MIRSSASPAVFVALLSGAPKLALTQHIFPVGSASAVVPLADD